MKAISAGIGNNSPFFFYTGGESFTNPFGGSANDVPITNICRTIEIDMGDMLEETNLPPALTPGHFILM